MFSDPSAEIRKASEYVPISRDQLSLAGLDVSKRSEAVNLQFVDELVRVKRFSDGVKAGWGVGFGRTRLTIAIPHLLTHCKGRYKLVHEVRNFHRGPY
jgi:hypothetical protein